MSKNITLTDGQQSFLTEADRMGVKRESFGSFVPEVQFQEEQPDTTKPTIAYIHTGGTLMMGSSPDSPEVLSFSNALEIKKVMEVCQYMARVRERYNIIGIRVCNQDSKEVTSEVWSALAATIKTVYPKIDGAAVGTGTNTFEHTCAATAFALQKLGIPI